MKSGFFPFLFPLFWGCLFSLSGCQTVPQNQEPNRPVPTIATPPSTLPPPQIQSLKIKKYFSKNPKKNLSFPLEHAGYFLYDPHTHQLLDSHRADQEFIPASTIKVLSSLFALRILEPPYRFQTQVATHGKLQPDGLLKGHLYLKGGGDPLLSYADLMSLAQALRKKGIKKISGHFYYDDTLYQSSPSIQLRRDDWASYNPGISALSAESNQFRLVWKPLSPGEPRVQEVFSTPDFSSCSKAPSDPPFPPCTPFAAAQQFAVAAEVFRGETGVFYQKEEGEDIWKISPHLTQGGQTKLPHHLPSQATAEMFRRFCLMEGISLSLPQAQKLPPKAKILATHWSRPVEELVSLALDVSHNLVTELLMLAAAQKLHPQRPLSLSGAAQALEDWSRKHLHFKDPRPFQLENGSGLSSQSRIILRSWIPILLAADQLSLSSHRSFQTLLPISGWKGTLQQKWTEPGIAFRIWAKTGSLSYVSSLVGYLYTQSGKRLLFGMHVNDLENRKKIDEDRGPISDPKILLAQQWTRRATQFMENQLKEWIETY